MHMPIRIKASEDYADVQALAFVEGRHVDGVHPKFVFSSPTHRKTYDEIRRRLKGGESLEAIARSYNVSGRAAGVPGASDETRQS